MEVPESMGNPYGHAQDLLVTCEHRDGRFVTVCVLRSDSINNIKRKERHQVCNQNRGYSRGHQSLEVNNSPDSTKLLSRRLTLSMHLLQASARR